MSKYGPFSPETKFTFGKWKTEPMWKAIDEDPEYVNWCIEKELVELDNESWNLFKHNIDENGEFIRD